MFKQIIYNNIPTQYIICDDGVIYNTKTHRNIYGSKSNGYVYVQLTIENQLVGFALHRLLAEYFIPNPENKEVVHHIDGNPLNNHLNNLMWLTQQENCQLRLKISPKIENTIPIFSQEELATEIWVNFRDSHYQVSNLGRYKNLKNNKIYMGSQNKNSGYIRWAFSSGEVQAHRAVYEAFHPTEKIDIINHIDGNRANNRLNNLENITQSDNVLKSYHETKTRKITYLAQYDLRDNLIDVYATYQAVVDALGVANRSVVRNAVLNNYTCKGFKIKIVDAEFYQAHKLDKIDVS